MVLVRQFENPLRPDTVEDVPDLVACRLGELLGGLESDYAATPVQLALRSGETGESCVCRSHSG